jgi:hypothetical protein
MSAGTGSVTPSSTRTPTATAAMALSDGHAAHHGDERAEAGGLSYNPSLNAGRDARHHGAAGNDPAATGIIHLLKLLSTPGVTPSFLPDP